MDGETYHFCSAGCRAKFADDPAKYLTSHAPGAPPPTGSQDAIYTCPMHPQIRQKRPGNCPICGMALEPEGIAVSEGTNPELIDMTRRFWIGAALAEIGRASCRERVCQYVLISVVAESLKKKEKIKK